MPELSPEGVYFTTPSPTAANRRTEPLLHQRCAGISHVLFYRGGSSLRPSRPRLASCRLFIIVGHVAFICSIPSLVFAASSEGAQAGIGAPKRAYRDVKPLLKLFADDNDMKTKALPIYDPYICGDKTVGVLGDLGFKNVINPDRDFYADVAAGETPPHKVLLTNLPYAGDHKAKLLSSILDQQRGASPVPFLLLLPAHTVGRALFRQFLWCLWRLREGEQTVTLAEGKDAVKGGRRSSSGIDSALLEEFAGVCYVCPTESYEITAAGAAKDKAPLFGIWCCGGLDAPSKRKPGAVQAAGDGGGVTRVEAAIAAAQRKRAERKKKRQAGGAEEEGLRQDETASRARVLRSLTALRAAGLVKSEAEEAKRHKRAKLQHARALAAMSDANVGTHRYAAVGEALPEELLARVRANKKACHHFFGGDKGCTLGLKCRFTHSV